MLKTKFSLLLFCFIYQINAQNLNYAKKIVDTLCSETYKGRGYVDKGDYKSAQFISEHLKRNGVSPFKENNNSYLQAFTLNVNTFPSKMLVKNGKKELVVGKEYIVNPASGSDKGKYTPYMVTPERIKQKEVNNYIFSNNYGKRIIVIDLKKIDDKKKKNEFKTLAFHTAKYGPTIILNNEKLTWSTSKEAFDHSLIEIVDTNDIFNPNEKVQLSIKNEFLTNYQTNNVIGYIPGTQESDSFIVFSAHYDHLGTMGSNTYIPGASDNASGIATLLDLASYYAKNPLKSNIAFIAFSGEESGLLGSKYYTENPIFDLNQIKFLLNIDIMGGGEDGIGVVNGSVFKRQMNILDSINNSNNYVKRFKVRGKAANSDHYWFSEKGVPCFFFYTMGGTTHYHDVFDTPESLTWGKYQSVFNLIKNFLISI